MCCEGGIDVCAVCVCMCVCVSSHILYLWVRSKYSMYCNVTVSQCSGRRLERIDLQIHSYSYEKLWSIYGFGLARSLRKFGNTISNTHGLYSHMTGLIIFIYFLLRILYVIKNVGKCVSIRWNEVIFAQYYSDKAVVNEECTKIYAQQFRSVICQ